MFNRYRPTSLYTIPYWLKYDDIKNSNFYCHNNIPLNKRTMNEIKSFVEHAQSLDNELYRMPSFSFSFANHETHDYLTVSGSYDRNLRDLIDYLEAYSYLNNTLFILFSDHGSRLTGKSAFTFLLFMNYAHNSLR